MDKFYDDGILVCRGGLNMYLVEVWGMQYKVCGRYMYDTFLSFLVWNMI
jgi:hypothetical protein